MLARESLLLTGATGQLGQYLLGEFLAAGCRVGVLVRDAPGRRAVQRLDELLAGLEGRLGQRLPRPTLLIGDLGDGLSLAAAERSWLSCHCGAVVHAAADVSFRPGSDGELWRTNVEGTRCLHRICRRAGVAEWHHVSTAFVCGRRNGPIAEEDLDAGPGFHNPYEQSKFEAERFLRREGGPRLTVYRPTVIVGDSRTGHTSTYSGFYRFLELASRLAEKPSSAAAPRHLPLRLPARGDEPCELVPVDWVSRAIAGLVARPAWHGRTFQLAAQEPVPSGLIYRVAIEELGLSGAELVGADGVSDPSRLEEMFLEGLREYWSYLTGCPAFARANVAAALPELPAPTVDAPVLRRLIRFAVADNWGRGRRPPSAVEGAMSPCARYIERVFPAQARRSPLGRAAGLHLLVGIVVDGPGGGKWSCRWTGGELSYVRPGLEAMADVVYHTDPSTFAAVLRGRLTPQEAFFEQRVAITGDLEAALKLAVLFGQFLRENPSSLAGRTEAVDAAPF
jgi:thioester reductase-like protein